MGNIIVPVTVASVLERDKEIAFDALVDSGAFGLILPAAWKERLGALPDPVMVDVETADQRIVPAEVCGPVRIQIGGFRRVLGEVIFMEMQPGRRGYEPLVGYTVLELAGAVIDMVTHRLLARKYFDLKVVTAAPGGPTARAAHPAPR